MAKLAREFLKNFALGHSTAVEVRRLARAAWEDGWGRGSVIAKRLASRGIVGKKNEPNASRDIMNIALNYAVSTAAAKPYMVRLQDDSTLGIYLPHELYPALVGEHTDDWCMDENRLNTEPMGAVLRTWAAHDDVNYEGDLTKVGAIGFHYDGVQYTSALRNGKSVYIASMNVQSARSDEKRAHRVPLFALRKDRFCECGCGGYCTLQIIYAVIAWSMRHLCHGVAPHRRHDDSPFH